jgi:hypothetical protein
MESETQRQIVINGHSMPLEAVTQAVTQRPTVPVSFIPTPTGRYRTYRKARQATVEPGRPSALAPVPRPKAAPVPTGTRVLMWKQDPSVSDIGIRKAFLPNLVLPGPSDARITIKMLGLPPVTPNVMGDLIQSPGTPEFDAVHTYAVVRQTLTMYQRALGTPAPWQWNTPENTEPLLVLPHGADMINAFYSRDDQQLNFGFFTPPGSPPGSPATFTCRSLDIVAHETGHAILDALKPNWILFGQPPQTGGLHESFGDLTAIFLALSQLDQVEAIIAQTKANLHDKTFLSDLAEEFGLVLGRPNGLRNADNDLKLSEVGNEVHAISQVFTGAIYDIVADIFAFERNPEQKDDARTLYEVGQYVFSLVVRAIEAAPDTRATFADVANQMLTISQQDSKPVEYRNFIRNRFTVREVFEAVGALTATFQEGATLKPGVQDAADFIQNRSACCGTMQLFEYNGEQQMLQAERDTLKQALAKAARGTAGSDRRART